MREHIRYSPFEFEVTSDSGQRIFLVDCTGRVVNELEEVWRRNAPIGSSTNLNESAADGLAGLLEPPLVLRFPAKSDSANRA